MCAFCCRAAYDDHLLVLYKLFMEHRRWPYNYYGTNYSFDWREQPWQDHVIASTARRYASLAARVLPDHVTACYAAVVDGPDRLNLTARPRSRHDANGFFELVGDGVNGTTARVGRGNRIVRMELRVRRDVNGKPLWDQCGDLFNVRVRHTAPSRTKLNQARLPRAVVAATVVDTFNYSYAITFEVPRGVLPHDRGHWEMEVVHSKHRFNALRPFAGAASRTEPWVEYLHDYIAGSPFVLNITDDDPNPVAPELLPDCDITDDAVPGAYIDNVWVPAHCRYAPLTNTSFETCLHERNLCLIVVGASVTRNIYGKVMAYTSPDRRTYRGQGMLSWQKQFHHEFKDEWKNTLRPLAPALANRTTYYDSKCTTWPNVSVVLLVNSGVHDAAWNEHYAYFALGVEWLVTYVRLVAPSITVIWRRTQAVNLAQLSENVGAGGTVLEREQIRMTDYTNSLSTTRIELLDLMARLVFRAHNLPVVDAHSCTAAAREYLESGDMRHYHPPKLHGMVEVFYNAMCTGPRLPTVSQSIPDPQL